MHPEVTFLARGSICSTIMELGTPKPYLVWLLGTYFHNSNTNGPSGIAALIYSHPCASGVGFRVEGLGFRVCFWFRV